MKAVILAGGSGTRLNPFTLITNKHLLPVYDKPVIYHAVEKLVSAGIDRIMIITSPQHHMDFVSMLGSGQDFFSRKNNKQIQIVYGIQNEPRGIAEGLYIAKDYIGNDSCVLYLGDNILEDDISEYINNFKEGAMILLKEVDDPERFGIATVDDEGNVLRIEEKPKNPESNLAVVGVYVYDNSVFQKMINQPQSERGEYEITYLNNKYIEEGKLKHAILKKDWFDIGTLESLLEAGKFMYNKTKETELSLVIPCYNEELYFKENLKRLKDVLDSTTYNYEMIILDDASADKTAEIAENFVKSNNIKENIKFIKHIQNQGRGKTVSDGIRAACGKIVGFIDIDLSTDPWCIFPIISEIEKGADVVLGLRVYKLKLKTIHRWILSKGYKFLVRIFLGLDLGDTESGCKFFRRERIMGVLDQVKDDKWFWDTEIIALSYLAGLKIVQVPTVFIRESLYSSVKIIEDSCRYFINLLRFSMEIRKIKNSKIKK